VCHLICFSSPVVRLSIGSQFKISLALEQFADVFVGFPSPIGLDWILTFLLVIDSMIWIA
jgi:hypothetical protein